MKTKDKEKKTIWRKFEQVFPFSDQNITISYYARADFDLAQLQCNFKHGEMTKWQLFKRLIFRIWHKL